MSEIDQQPTSTSAPSPARARGARNISRRRAVTLAAALVLTSAVGGAGAWELAQRHLPQGDAPPGVVDPLASGVVIVAPTVEPTIDAQPPANVETLQPGDVLDANPGMLQDGLRAIGLNDGTWHIVSPTDPLPDVVQSAIAAESARAAELPDMQLATSAREDIDTWVFAQAGLHPVLVIPWQAATEDGAQDAWAFWSRDDVQSFLSKPGDLESVTAEAHAWVERHQDPAQFVVVTPR